MTGRLRGVALIGLSGGLAACWGQALNKEYVYLGDRLVAIEPGATSPNGDATATPTRLVLSANGGTSSSITVSAGSTQVWRVTGVPSWLTPSKTQGNGNDTFTVSAGLNNSGSARIAILRVGLSDIQIEQPASNVTGPGIGLVSPQAEIGKTRTRFKFVAHHTTSGNDIQQIFAVIRAGGLFSADAC